MQRLLLFPSIILIFVSTSCVRHKQLLNFNKYQGLPFGELEEISNLKQPTIQTGDILQVSVDSYNAEAAEPFNRNSSTRGGGGNQQTGTGNLLLMGYLVDSMGCIDFPVLGRVPLRGLTLQQAHDTLRVRLYDYLTDPVVNVRYLNYRFTILGEVNKPGSYSTFNTRISLFEALGMANDLTYYANRERVTVIREQDGIRTYSLLNLKDKEIMNSPCFYLKQNDVIYIEPMPARITSVSDPLLRWIGFFTTGVSLVSLFLTLTSF